MIFKSEKYFYIFYNVNRRNLKNDLVGNLDTSVEMAGDEMSRGLF